MANRNIRRQVESIKRQKIVSKKIVNLAEFRELSRQKERKTILVVDDDEIMRAALKRILEGDSYNVILAQDGMELSKILESRKFDLILLDVNLPWVDGYELCRIIKQHPATSDIPLIFVSANNTEEDVQKGFEAGCSDYVTKPFDVDFMTNKINDTVLKASS